MVLSVSFTLYTRNGNCDQTFILCETNLFLIKDRYLSAENILIFDEIIEIKELIITLDNIDNIDNIDNNSLIKCLFDLHAVFSNSDRGRHVVEERLQQAKVKS